MNGCDFSLIVFVQRGWEVKQMKDGRIFFVDHSE